jgi:hypothetical protein
MAVGWSIDTGPYVHKGRLRGGADRAGLHLRGPPNPIGWINNRCFTVGRSSLRKLTLTERLLCRVALGFRGLGLMVRTLFVTAR